MEKQYVIVNNAGFYFKGDDQAIGERLQEIENLTGGLTPEAVVVDARKKSSPYHNCFDWSDKVAANKWRLHTARNLIHCVKIKVGEDKDPIPAFVSVRFSSPLDRNYMNVEAVIGDEDIYQNVLEEIDNQVNVWKKRYSMFEGLPEFFDKIKEEIDAVKVR